MTETVKTFDDILLVPKYSDVSSRSENLLETRISTNLKLNIPIVSSNMDTVTEDKMAIAIAEMGGIGILHRFCSIEKQIEMINNVKRKRNFVIEKPYSIFLVQSFQSIYDKFEQTGVNILIVYDRELGFVKFLGIIKKKDFMIHYKTYTDKSISLLDYIKFKNEKLIEYCRCVKESDIDIEKCISFFKNSKSHWMFIQNTIENNEYVKLVTLKDILCILEHKNALVDSNFQLVVGAAVGVKDDYLERTKKCLGAGVDVIVIDIAHGHSVMMKEAVTNIKKLMNEIEIKKDIIAGNVATYEGAKFLADLGVNGIKVGIGNGSICSTRLMTGCGYPQFSALMECSKIKEEHPNVPLISDGGNQGKIGNICKALAIGGSTVMLGNFISGTDESPGVVFSRGKEKVKYVRGMAGLTANKSKWNKLGEKDKSEEFVPEGVDAFIKYKGGVKSILHQIKQGIRSCMSYCGSKTIEELHNNSSWIAISESSKVESGIHGVNLL